MRQKPYTKGVILKAPEDPLILNSAGGINHLLIWYVKPIKTIQLNVLLKKPLTSGIENYYDII